MASKLSIKRKDSHQKKNKNQATQNAVLVNVEEEEAQSPEQNQDSLSRSQLSIAESVNSKNSNLFQQFKTKYDQLKEQYDLKRAEADKLNLLNKKLQIKLMSNNTDYYEKQAKRLKDLSEKYQEQNEDNKHSYLQALNQKKELQATIKFKNQETRQLSQKLEKQKINVIELKHQITEKQKCNKKILSEMEKSHQILSESYQDLNNKITKLETGLKIKTSEYDNLKKNHESKTKKLSQVEKQLTINREKFEKMKEQKIKREESYELRIRMLNRTSQQTIQKLSFDLNEAKSQRNGDSVVIQSNQSDEKQKMLQLELVRYEDKNRQLQYNLKNKLDLIQKLETRLKNTYGQDQYQQLERKVKQLEKKYETQIKEYQEKLLRIQKEREQEKFETFVNPAQSKNVSQQFQQLLRVQIQQNARIKKQLSVKIDEVFNLKSDVEQYKFKIRGFEEEIEIMKKKIKTLEKNHKIESQVKSQNMKGDVDSMKRKIEMIEKKLESKIKEVKQKENFIISTIVGRSKAEDAPFLVAEFKRIFQMQYQTKLAQAQKKIAELTSSE